MLTIVCLAAKGQYDNNWQFGNLAGLNFNSTPPAPLTGGQSTCTDNNAAISDNAGNLLFYTDGSTVWDKNNNIMPNGTGLIGSFTAGQCAVIVPIPCSSTQYVIFHVTEYSSPGYLHYTVVDMSLNSGLGDVVTTQKNVSLGSGCTEKLCAYYNPNGNYYWLVTHKWQSDQFFAFKVDAGTIATTSVTTAIGTVHSCGVYSGTHDAMGQLTISPDGQKLVNALTCSDKFELFDFDINTSVLSNSITIAGNGGSAWGTAFSPDSKKLYTDAIFGSSIYQYDLSSNNQTIIQASLYTVYTYTGSGYIFGYLQLGPDGKIYTPRPMSSWLSVVNTPNLAGAACTFSYSGLQIPGSSLNWGLSRSATNIAARATQFSLTATSNSITCFGFSNGSASAITPSMSGNYSYLWMPGNYITQTVSGLSPGIYTVQASNACASNSAIVTVTQPAPLSLIVSPDKFICRNQTAILSSTVSGGTPTYSYTWSNNNFSPTTNVMPFNTTTYTLNITDANGCNSTACTTVSVVICDGILSYTDPKNDVTIFPSISSNMVNIASPSQSISKVICQGTSGQLLPIIFEAERNRVNLETLEVGLYYLRFYLADGRQCVKKVIKE